MFNAAAITDGDHGGNALGWFLMGTDQYLETERPVPEEGVGKGERLPGACVSDTRQAEPVFLAEQHHPVARMEIKGPEAGDKKDSAEEEKDRCEGFPVHIGRELVDDTMASEIGRRVKNISRCNTQRSSRSENIA